MKTNKSLIVKYIPVIIIIIFLLIFRQVIMINEFKHILIWDMIIIFIISLLTIVLIFLIALPTEKRLIKLFSKIQGPLFLINRENLEILLVNEDGKTLIRNKKSNEKMSALTDLIELISYDIDYFINKIKTEEKIDNLEIDIKNDKGEGISFLMSSKKAKYKNNDCILLVFFDITSQKQVHEKMRSLTVRDQLTGLYNRHFLDEIIEEEMQRANRYNFDLSVLILDLDFFKKINDTYGHPVGDIILKETADLASNHLRRSDFLIRLGGEEFLFLMPHTNLKEARIVADKIRKEIEGLKHPIVGNFTASFGVAQWNKKESYKELYERVDAALYSAKEEGRNRVNSAEELVYNEESDFQFKWKEEWNSGNEIIDKQHKNLVNMANGFLMLTINKADYELSLKKIEELHKHMGVHFNSEADILKETNYIGYVEHVKIHNNILKEINDMKESFEKGEIKITSFFTFILDDFIVGHILDEDTKFFEHINNYKERS